MPKIQTARKHEDQRRLLSNKFHVEPKGKLPRGRLVRFMLLADSLGIDAFSLSRDTKTLMYMKIRAIAIPQRNPLVLTGLIDSNEYHRVGDIVEKGEFIKALGEIRELYETNKLESPVFHFGGEDELKLHTDKIKK